MDKYIIDSLDTINNTAKEFLKKYNSGVFCFYGEMGAGKTTFIKALCEELNVKDNVTSPSFAIINEYKTNDNKTIFHFDFYRIKDENEAFDMGYEDYFYSENTCFVEWPEKINSLLPNNRVDVTITVSDNLKRIITVEQKNN